ncbi:MAG: preprotein translocase subunit YajC [Neisseriaceae bacterium]|nr:preprotein translocase subunit YajC [Neisseriaceae bacterium]
MIDFAFAADAAGTGSLITQFAPLLLILVVFYFLIMRPQQKKFKNHQKMISELTRGTKVITSSGIAGKITKVDERFFTIEIAAGVEVQIERSAIASIVEN